jgi:hypothetical protein
MTLTSRWVTLRASPWVMQATVEDTQQEAAPGGDAAELLGLSAAQCELEFAAAVSAVLGMPTCMVEKPSKRKAGRTSQVTNGSSSGVVNHHGSNPLTVSHLITTRQERVRTGAESHEISARKDHPKCTTQALILTANKKTRSQLLLRTDNCPQPTEFRPLSHGSDNIQ